MIALLQEDPTHFTKCTFRVDIITRGRSYHGELPTPDSPNIHIPGFIRGVFEDDFVVLELQPSAEMKDEEGQVERSVGIYKGIHKITQLNILMLLCWDNFTVKLVIWGI